MKIIRTVEAWKKIRASFPVSKSIGYVATMGNLHSGHESLFLRSKRENEISIASLFINPTQFNEKSDYERYPRTEEEDLEILKRAEIDYVLIPLREEMYHDEYSFKIHTTHPVSLVMEGVFRPGHFDGMLTVVLKLLMLARPKNAYFGEKDYQQLILIREMAQAYFLDVNIVGCETIRDQSGLALSSRNNLLTKDEKLSAEKINKMLGSKMSASEIKDSLVSAGFEVEYVERFMERIFVAAKIGNVRLIDNVVDKVES
jgi:pantoate--beta-alanine ligase